ncbi:hypothetical protein [Microcoleus sp. PH2017_20_SFW_D_A]|uniref:hypothetical protein n=1 Tax=Microcoleus sp. PH2017_20_SFW_D_A TaxID=2798831 RepID=UPI001DD84DFE|nr:hypothetical protein [Microcoleus sp. PH2017_20_SFW_D_A]MCC3507475.1 hypothetical protein [Microcoleus sp. PH2017_19_SFW_U_A]MCC3526388.1 hypothetical protein [Microcoleus sp. PH2017_20_SFW_D_A]
MAYKNDGTFNVLYKTRNKIAKTLRRIIAEENLIDTEALYDSIRINAKIPALGELEIQILAMYYFGFLNNGTINMLPFDLCAKLTARLNAEGTTAEIYQQYTEWMAKRYPILQVARILGEKKSIVYTFEPIGGEFSAPLKFRGF